MASVAPRLITPEEYLVYERASEVKHEYIDGVVYAMAGASLPHSAIASNLIRGLGNRLAGQGCQVHGSDLKVAARNWRTFVYPDVSVFCGAPEQRDDDVLLNPKVIIEVLSPSTATYDRHTKLKRYKSIETVEAIVLVEQAFCWIEVFTRRGDGIWEQEELDSLDQDLVLPAIDCKIPLAEIYAQVDLGPAPTAPAGDSGI